MAATSFLPCSIHLLTLPHSNIPLPSQSVPFALVFVCPLCLTPPLTSPACCPASTATTSLYPLIFSALYSCDLHLLLFHQAPPHLYNSTQPRPVTCPMLPCSAKVKSRPSLPSSPLLCSTQPNPGPVLTYSGLLCLPHARAHTHLRTDTQARSISTHNDPQNKHHHC